MKKLIPILTVLLIFGAPVFAAVDILAAPVPDQDIRGTGLRLVVGEKPIPPKTPEEISAAIKDLPDADDYDNLTDEEKAEVKDKVDSIVEGIENLPEEEQAKIPRKDIEKLGELYDKVYNVIIHKNTSAASGLTTRVPEEDIQVYGAGMAAAALGGDVKIIIRQDLPPDDAVMAFTFELYLKQDGDSGYTRVQLRTPLVIRLKLPDSVKAEGLTIRHIREDGRTEILTPEIDGRMVSFMPTHFSNFLFIEREHITSVQQDTIRRAIRTGDNTPIELLLLLCGAAIITTGAVFWKKKRTK